ncbi:hypothetical protein [uncultured Pseudacidovorax sp.]|uniref:hypothetical protein n=1 Tax=uncultured Pseudacidovorax sp. TaxID=679313 RepID=UPI0025ECEA93|nr:hypothetical protein [uncultured Pseudacidovorax sp.]
MTKSIKVSAAVADEANARAVAMGAAALPGVPDGVPAEEVASATLGPVIVRGALFTEVLADDVMASREKPRAGEDEQAAAIRAAVEKTVRTLAHQVLGSDGEPLKTYAEWNVFGVRHRDEALHLFNVARRLNGSAEDAEKN